MRAAGQRKCGFYPADPELAGRLGKMMTWPTDKPVTVIDPCAGCGEAVRAFVPAEVHEFNDRSQVYAVELARNRAEACREQLGDDHVLWCAFEQTRITWRCFSACWLNPPYDDEIGGGKRCELDFLQRATALLVDGGVLVFLAPKRIIQAARTTKYLAAHYEEHRLFDHPPTERPGYASIDVGIFVGRRRKQPLARDGTWFSSEPFPEADGGEPLWQVPPGRKPIRFEKGGLTDEELVELVQRSSVWTTWRASGPVAIGRPLLPLKLGHIPMVLASGRLNGRIGDHIARATVAKEFKTVETREREDTKGRVRTQDVQHEHVRLSIRVLARREGKAGVYDFV